MQTVQRLAVHGRLYAAEKRRSAPSSSVILRKFNLNVSDLWRARAMIEVPRFKTIKKTTRRDRQGPLHRKVGVRLHTEHLRYLVWYCRCGSG
jgi:hypothetical protein